MPNFVLKTHEFTHTHTHTHIYMSRERLTNQHNALRIIIWKIYFYFKIIDRRIIELNE